MIDAFRQNDLWARCRAGVASVVADLRVEGDKILTAARVFDMESVDVTKLEFPCAVATTEEEQEEELDGGSECTQTVYPVRVFFADKLAPNETNAFTVLLAWRKLAMKKFSDLMTLPEVSECYDLEVRPRIAIDRQSPNYQHVVTGFVVACHCSEPRDKAFTGGAM